MLAIIDSGVGGLSVWVEVKKLLPHNSLLYYADTAHCPYGVRSKVEIESLTIDVVQKVVDAGAQIVVVACNTMTAGAISTLRSKWKDIDFVGMEPAVKPAAQSSKSGVVGILATRATLSGRLYNKTRNAYASKIKIIETAGDGLVECVERGEMDGEHCLGLIRGYILPMVEAGADTLVLGCTHYPFLRSSIECVARELGCGLNIINPAPAVARRAVELATKRGIKEQDAEPQYEFATSGNEVDLRLIKELASKL